MNEGLKRAAARAAIEHLQPGVIVGVGSGSTVGLFIEELAPLRGRLPGAVCASRQSAEKLGDLGIAVFDLNEVIASGKPLPVYVDGADEVDPTLQMIKGGGGALTREKILATACARFVCIVDRTKLVEKLGCHPLPVEVIPMARELVSARLRALGGEPRVRSGFVTENGNSILDVVGLQLSDPVGLEGEITGWPGVVSCGLFARRRADVALVASPEGVRCLDRGSDR